MQAALTPITEAGEAHIYLSAVVGDITGFVGVSALLERGARPRVLLDKTCEAKVFGEPISSDMLAPSVKVR